MTAPPPATEAERRFEFKLLKEIKILLDDDMPIDEILNVLIRTTELVTQIAVEASGKQ